jgi:hypothetical protein
MKALPLLAAVCLVAGVSQSRASGIEQPDAAPAVAAPATAEGEPLPAGAPQDPYELAAWCYGALDQYLYIYENVIPQLKAIDKAFGSSVKNEAQPYADDMAAARVELKVLASAVESAERASPQVISTRGAAAVMLGRSIWAPAEQHTRRELARAWLSWALPDRCDSNARELKARSDLLGQVLKYNVPSATSSPRAPVTTGDETSPGDALPAPAPGAQEPAPASANPGPSAQS